MNEFVGRKLWDVLEELGFVYFDEYELTWNNGFYEDADVTSEFHKLKDYYVCNKVDADNFNKLKEEISEIQKKNFRYDLYETVIGDILDNQKEYSKKEILKRLKEVIHYE